MDGIYSWTLERNAARCADYGRIVSKLKVIKSNLKVDPIPSEYFANLSCAPDSWIEGFKSSEEFIASLTTKDSYVALYSKYLTANKLFTPCQEETSFILKSDANHPNQNSSKNIAQHEIEILISEVSNVINGFHSFNIQIVSRYSDSSLRYQPVSPSKVHLCLYADDPDNTFLPVSWYGKPDYDVNGDVWRWGPWYFCPQDGEDETFPNSKIFYNCPLFLGGPDSEVKIVAFVKID